MNQLIPILADCIVPFFDPFTLANFIRCSRDFYEAANCHSAKYRDIYLFHYNKDNHDIKYIFSPKNTHNFCDTLFRETSILRIYQAIHNGLVAIDTIIYSSTIETRSVTCHYNDLKSATKQCAVFVPKIWIGPQSFSVTIIDEKKKIVFIFLKSHYGDEYKSCYDSIIQSIMKNNPYYLFVRYGTTTTKLLTLISDDGEYAYCMADNFVYPEQYKLCKTVHL